MDIIEQREIGAESNKRPFYAGYQVIKVKEYSQKLVIVLCHHLRVYDQVERPSYELTGKQYELVQLLKAIAGSEDVPRKI
jgi:hypothetical protein